MMTPPTAHSTFTPKNVRRKVGEFAGMRVGQDYFDRYWVGEMRCMTSCSIVYKMLILLEAYEPGMEERWVLENTHTLLA